MVFSSSPLARTVPPGGTRSANARKECSTSSRSLKKKSRWSASMFRITATVGEEGQEGVAVLAGLQDDGFALPHPVAGAQDREGTANHHRGVNPGRHGNVGTHRGCGCFAVGARDAQGILVPPHDGAPGLGPLKYRDAQGMGRAISGLSSWTAAVRITRSLPSTLSPGGR